MATISVTNTTTLSALTYAKDDTIDIADGVTLNISQSNSVLPMLIQANGTGKINISNTSTTSLLKLSFSATSSSAGLKATQNASITARGNWITVATTTGIQQTLFNCTSVGGSSIDYPTLVEIETGENTGVYEIWPVVPETVTGGHTTPLGFNTERSSDGTVAISSTGVVTGTGTAFPSTSTGLQFRCNSIARDFIIDTWTSATSMALIELDGSAYAGGVVSAGTTYFIRDGSTIDREVVGKQDVGKMLFFNPVTGAVGTGNDINGTVPPTGAKVRIPNIYITSEIPQTTLASAITVTTATNITLTAAIGPTTNDASSTTADNGELLIVEGTKVERIYYRTRSGTTISSTSMLRAQHRTKAQTFSAGATVYWIPASGRTTNNVQFNTSSSGVIDAEIVALCPWFANRPTAANYYRLNHVGSSGLYWLSCPGDFEINWLSVLGRNFRHLIDGITGSGINCASNLGAGEINDVVVVDNHSGKSSNVFNVFLSNVAGLTSLSRIKAMCFYADQKLSGASNNAIYLTSVSCSNTIQDMIGIGGAVRFSLNASQAVEGIHVSSNVNSYAASSNSIFYNVAAYQSPDCILRKFDIVSGGSGAIPYFIYIDATVSGLTVHNRGMPALDGGGRLKALARDFGADTKLSSFTLTNMATGSPGILDSAAVSNSGGRYSMLLTDSQYIPVTTTGGPFSKGLAEVDIGQGNRRYLSATTTVSLLSGMFDVQVQIVASNTQRNDCMVIVGPFSAQSKWDLLDTTGLIGGNLDNLGRIYMKANGDTVIIKCPVSLKGIASFLSTPLTFYHQGSAYGVSGVPADVTLEVRMVNWGDTHTGPWTPYVDGSTLETLRAQLIDYDSSVGIDLQWRMVKVGANASWYVIEFTAPVTLDLTYDPPVGFVSIGVTNVPIGANLVGYDSTLKKVGSLVTQVSSGTIKFPYNYDSIARPYTLVCRKAGYSWFSVSGDYDRFATSIPTQMQPMASYLPGVTGVTFDFVNHTISMDQDRTGQEIFSAYQDELSKVANCKIPEFCSFNSNYLTTTYAILSTGGGMPLGNYTDSSGINTKIRITGLLIGSTVEVYNVTDGVSLYNQVTTTATVVIPVIYTSDKVIRLRAAKMGYLRVRTINVLSQSGLTFSDVQYSDQIYVQNAVDGSTCTEFTDDDPNADVLINAPTNQTSLQRLYAWACHYFTTLDGISGPFFDFLRAVSTTVYQIDSSVGDIQLNNVKATPLVMSGGTIEMTDGSSVIHPLSGSIQIPGNAYAAPNTAEEIATVVEAKLNVALNQVLDNLLSKADKSDVSTLQALIGTRTTPADLATTQSVITTALSSGLSVKADKTDISGVISALSNKPDTFDLTQTETNITTAITTGLSTKADKADVAGVATSVASVATTLTTKADKSDIIATETTIVAALDAGLLNNADKTDVAAIVAAVNNKPGQAELTAVETAITTAIDAGLAGKVDKTDLAPLAKESSIKNVISFIASS